MHGVVEKYWAKNEKPWVLDLALGTYLCDPEELTLFIHSLKCIVYLWSDGTMMNPYSQEAESGEGIHTNNENQYMMY